MGDAGNDSAKTATQDADAPSPDKRRRRAGGQRLRSGTRAVRSKIASLVWLAAVICALFLAVGALVVALRMNQDNTAVAFVLDAAERLDFGELKEFGGGKDAETKGALVNWGIPAVVYLLIGKVLDRVIRP